MQMVKFLFSNAFTCADTTVFLFFSLHQFKILQLCSISTWLSERTSAKHSYSSGSMRQAIPQPADNSRGTGTSLPAMPWFLQNVSISIAAAVV